VTGLDVEGALYDHRQGALTCYDHPPTPDHPAWCCVCGAHGLMVSWRAHVAGVLREQIAAAQAEALVPIRRNAEAQAVTARARGLDERPWLDVLILCDRAVQVAPSRVPREGS
jgi:hypothetical protein